jgi:hypothetical protein
MNKVSDRVLGSAAAIFLQVGFLFFFLQTVRVVQSPTTSARELTLSLPLLRPALQKSPPNLAPARSPVRLPPRTPLPFPSTAPLPGPVQLAPPSGIAGFGRSLFGCAPEHYADLPPDERAHCSKPGDGMAKNDDKDLLAEPRSHAKYEAMWQEQWTEDHWLPAPCPPTGEKTVAQCLIEQAIAERRRAQAAWDKIAEDQAAALKPKILLPPFPNRHGQPESNGNPPQK